MSSAGLGEVGGEYEDAEFGDTRLGKRLVQLASMLGVEPDASFPVASGGDAGLEATYRFLNNRKVKPNAILAPHARATVRRVTERREIVVAHDTTEFNFGGTGREDLGRVGQGQSYGFYGHFALAVDHADRQPLGILSVLVHERRGGKGRRGHTALQTTEDNESKRWPESVRQVERQLGVGRCIHVMDREGDSYALLAELASTGTRFVVRMAGAKRRIAGESTVGVALLEAPVITQREVPVTARGRNRMPAYRKHFPERNARRAQLEITAASVTVLRPDSSSGSPAKTLTLNAIRVWEPCPPTGEPPVEWRLWTNEPVASAEQVLAVVDAYRGRWVIEEYFKALKSGCAIEKRQLESSAGLQNTLAVFVPIAWRLLQLRTLSRDAAAIPAAGLLSPVQLVCLQLALEKRRRPPLPKTPTARDIMLGVAGLGGHIKNNGDPGWIVLGRGLDRLLLLEEGYRLATRAER